jgi:preprotein translocase subunit SecB
MRALHPPCRSKAEPDCRAGRQVLGGARTVPCPDGAAAQTLEQSTASTKVSFMADEGNIISDLKLDQSHEGAPNGEDTSPAIGLLTQYIKDLSVENPNAPESFQWTEAPEMNVDFNIGARTLSSELHEIELKINVTSKSAQGTAFIVELAYGALVAMRNVPDDQAHPFLFAECPRLVFPFARRIIADAVRDAGYPPLMLEPIDFNGLYIAQLQQQAAIEGEPAGQA